MWPTQNQQCWPYIWSLLLCWLSCASAELATNWTNPNGKLPSFSQTYTIGEQIILSWLALNDSTNDLWLTRFDTEVDHYAVRLERECQLSYRGCAIGANSASVSLDLSTAGSYHWAIALGAEEIMADTRFMFQFLPTGENYDPGSPVELASPGVNILLVNQQTPPNGTVGASTTTSTPTSTPQATGSLASAPTTTESSSEQGSESDLSSGTIAGIAVVVVALVLGSALMMFIFWKRHHRRTINIADDKSEKVTGPYEMLADRRQPAELNPKDTMLHELNDSRSILSEPSELPSNSVVSRPGLHELAG